MKPSYKTLLLVAPPSAEDRTRFRSGDRFGQGEAEEMGGLEMEVLLNAGHEFM